MKFHVDQLHAETLRVLEGVAQYISRLPAHPSHYDQVRKIQMHLEDPGVRLRREASFLRVGGIFPPTGYALIEVALQADTLYLKTDTTKFDDRGIDILLHRLEQGELIKLRVPDCSKSRNLHATINQIEHRLNRMNLEGEI